MSWLVRYKQIMGKKGRRKAGETWSEEEANIIFGDKTLETLSLKVKQNKDGCYWHVHVTFWTY